MGGREVTISIRVKAAFNKIYNDLSQKKYAPVYIVDGEETYYIDKFTQFFEENILSPAERDFNLLILYGKEVSWTDVVNTCRRMPMFADRQVVILKDAAQMDNLNELSNYVKQPVPSTILLIEHRFKKVDGRSALIKLVKEKGVYLTSEKIKDEQLPEWIQDFGNEINFEIPEKEAQMLATNVGNDLHKLVNEIEKVRINAPNATVLSADLIHRYIGISKDYNVFDIPNALIAANKELLYRMVHYFTANPKSAPMPLVIGSLYSFFNTLYQVHSFHGKREQEIGQSLKLYGARLKQIMNAAQKISLPKTEQCIMLLANYNTKSVGIGVPSNLKDGELFKEMIGKLEFIINYSS